MRLSQFPLSTTKETPADADIVSHKLMLRAGLIRKLGSGLYTWMPLGLRTLRKVENIAREYLNMRDAYTRIFTRLGAEFRVVKADSGDIGGARSEEFHILAGSGEDLLAVAEGGTYAANVEAADTVPVGTRGAPTQPLAK